MKQRHYIRLFLMLAVVPGQLVSAGPTGEALRLEVTPPTLLSGESNLSLQVTMTNRTTRPMTIVKSNPGCDFSADVRDATGQVVPFTPAGVELSHCASRTATGRWIRVILEPGKSTDEVYPIDLYYKLARPGIYTVRIWKELPSESSLAARSNEVILKLSD